MKIKQVFQTEDGVIHRSESDAKLHIDNLIGKDEVNFQNFCQSYSGRRLLSSHKLSEYGVWEIRGEDPNCDFGGHHHMPYLDTVECTLEKAIKHAITLDRWFTWGAGGEIKKIEMKKL